MRKQWVAAFAFLLFSLHVGAAQYGTDLLTIVVQAESYDAAVLDFGSGNVIWKHGAPYEILSDGVKFSPGEHISGGGDPELAGEKALMFSVTDLRFFAKPGYKITGYEFSFSGQVLTSNPGWSEIRGKMMGDDVPDPLSFQGDRDWAPYTFSTAIVADNPSGGQVSAYGWLYFDAPPIHDHFIDGATGDIVEYISGAGRAAITLDSLSVRAFVTAVPEPETYLMFLAGLGTVAWRAQRRARQRTMT
jgi:hypothetical protein